jgi:hypothetical protein
MFHPAFYIQCVYSDWKAPTFVISSIEKKKKKLVVHTNETIFASYIFRLSHHANVLKKKSEKSPFDIFLAFVDIVGMTKVA